MSLSDGVGFLAAVLTLLTFLQTAVVPMRLAAVAANLSFISYGVLADCLPVLVLHLILLPVNGFRLWASGTCQRRDRAMRGVATPASAQRARPTHTPFGVCCSIEGVLSLPK